MRSLQDLCMEGGESRNFAVTFMRLHKEEPSRLANGEWLISSECWRQTVLYLLNESEEMDGQKNDAGRAKLAEGNAMQHLMDCYRDNFCGWIECQLPRTTV